ncbi:MAG TPA: gliding motility-associated C-terminal domain-containing protein [Chitinophagales bacterium]|nr:gliding motility-associated C-terminal domain-containing protein [Chitinophagales bacterium]
MGKLKAWGILIIAACMNPLPLLHAQNLVLNPSFESTSSCPVGISQFSLVLNWDDTNSGNDTCTTPDLYAPCAPAFGGANSPNALMGYQQSHSGTHHAGAILYSFPTWREYMQGTLSSPLVAGQQYCVKFYISTANESRFATDDVGVYFSVNPLQKNFCLDGSAPHSVTPQLQYSGAPIADSLNWIPLEWVYTATGGERYLTIGNFKSDGNTTIIDFNTNIGLSIQPYAYYFFDDVEVTAVTCCPEINIASITNVSCYGGNDGSATVSPSGGVPPYGYAWSGGGGNNATTTNRTAGTYTVTVSDSRGCSVTKLVTIPQPAQLNVVVSSFSSGCGTSATASPAGGTPPYSYLWSNGATVASISNMPTGTYTVTVTDSKGCTKTGSVNITQTSGFTVNTSVTNPSCGACDGMATATPSGGNPPFSYSWSNGQTTQSASNLCAGTYTVTVTESAGSGSNVFWTEDFTSGGTGWTLNINGPGTNGANANQWVINNNTSDCSSCPSTGSGGNYLHVTCNPADITCFGSSGSCVYSPGVPIFSDAATDKYVTSPNISTIGKTGITLTFWYMSDGESGSDYGLVRLSNNGGASWTDLPTQYFGVATCTQASVPIPAAYENIADFRIGFRWVNDNNTTGSDPPFLIDDIELSSATGSTACTATATVNLSSAGGPSVTLASKTDVLCYGSSTGAIDINVSGGTQPYSYSWTGGAATQDISNLSGGNYSVTVTDNTNCAATLSVTINEPSAALSISGNVTEAGCGAPDGAIDLTVNGGTSPYAYAWSSGATSQDLTNLISGNYTVTVTDNNLCIDSASFTVNAPGSFSVTLTAADASCYGVADGAITSIISGGSPPFSYDWSNGAITSGISNIAEGSYSVTVTDDNNCTVAQTATVDAPSEISFNTSITQVLCSGGNNGGIKLSPSGGTPPYTASWSNGETTLTISDLPPDVYSVTVTDAHGCTRDTSIALTSVSEYDVETVVTNATCDGAANGSIQADILNGTTPPYSYMWSNGATTSTITNIAPGVYSVTVTDSLNCLRSDTATVMAGESLTITHEVTDESCPGSADGKIIVAVSGGTEPYSYLWSTEATTPSLQNITAGIYSLTVTDYDDCTGRDTIIVGVTSGSDCDTLVIYDVFSPNGDGSNDNWVIDGLPSDNELHIFNRWGNVVFEAKPYDNRWDGKSKNGELLPTATYYYILKLNDTKVYSGNVTLIR